MLTTAAASLATAAIGGSVLAGTTGPQAAERNSASRAVDPADPPVTAERVGAEPEPEGRPASEKTRLSRSAGSTVRPLAAGLVTDVPEHGSGRFVVALGTSDTVGSGTLATYTVEVEEDLDLEVAEVARHIEAVLADDRGWTALIPTALQRVPTDPVFRILIATPETTDALCAPLETGGRLSCRNGETVVLNAWRWVNGAEAYDGNLLGYRQYMINHEVGHVLGNAHAYCPEAGASAPVMLQQTKGLDGCRPNPWPVAATSP